jgi:hypothetical protein
VHVNGDDVSRSTAGRAAGESIWVPTALLPSFGAAWSATDDEHITVELTVDGHTVRVHHEIDDRGRIRSSRHERWGGSRQQR